MTAEPLERGLQAPDLAAAVHQAPRLRLLPTATSRSRQGSAESHDDALHRRALYYVQAVVEIVEGDRSVTQLLPWASPRVYDAVVARTDRRHRSQSTVGRRQRSSAHVVSVRVYQPHPEIAEVAAHVRFAGRSHAMAVRFELIERRWICTVLDWG